MILVINITRSSNSINNVTALNELSVFVFTHNNSVENYDYNNDGHGDYIFIHMEVNVNVPGLVSIQNFCFGPFIYFNSTSSSLIDFQSCRDLDKPLIRLDNTGLTNISFWIGYGDILANHPSPKNQIYNSVNMSIFVITNPVYSNITRDISTINSSNYTFNLYNLDSLSLERTDSGVVNSVTSLYNNQIIQGRSLTDAYIWNMRAYYSSAVSGSASDVSGTLSLNFDHLSSTFLEYTYTQIFPSASYQNSIFAIPEKEISNDTNEYFQLFIPQNITASFLKSYYNVVWSNYLDRHIDYQNLNNFTLENKYSEDYFGTFLSLNLNTTEYGSTSVTYTYKLIYHLPTGILSYLDIYYYNQTETLENITILLSSPNYGVTDVPANRTQPTTPQSSTDQLVTSQSSSSQSSSNNYNTITTTNYSFSPFYLMIPILVISLYKRKEKK